jgi:hypothetical protein
MCGITGLYSLNVSAAERDIFQGLLMVNVFRGEDSTGVIKMQNNAPKARVLRSTLASPGFISSAKGSEFIWDKDRDAKDTSTKTYGFIGHTRAATRGVVNIKNAHPFRFSDVIGVHNGTIQYAFEGSAEYDTDSEGFYALVNKYGIEEALNKIADADPAYALAYVDTKENTLNFVKNSKRPLYFTYMYNRTTLVWSSQREMIEFVLRRRSSVPNIEGWKASDKGFDKGFFTLEDNHLMTIKIGDPASQATIKKLNVKAGKTHFYRSGTNWNGDWGDWDSGVSSRGGGTTSNLTSSVSLPKKVEGSTSSSDGYGNFRKELGAERLSSLTWLDVEQKVEASSKAEASSAAKGSDGGSGQNSVLTPSEINFRLEQGCFCCGTVVDPSNGADLVRVRWWSNEHYACGPCVENESGDTSWVALAVEDTSNTSISVAAK